MRAGVNDLWGPGEKTKGVTKTEREETSDENGREKIVNAFHSLNVKKLFQANLFEWESETMDKRV